MFHCFLCLTFLLQSFTIILYNYITIILVITALGVTVKPVVATGDVNMEDNSEKLEVFTSASLFSMKLNPDKGFLGTSFSSQTAGLASSTGVMTGSLEKVNPPKVIELLVAGLAVPNAKLGKVAAGAAAEAVAGAAATDSVLPTVSLEGENEKPLTAVAVVEVVEVAEDVNEKEGFPAPNMKPEGVGTEGSFDAPGTRLDELGCSAAKEKPVEAEDAAEEDATEGTEGT